MGKEDKHRHFTREFKLTAVQLVTEKGMPVGKVARDLDIHPNLVHLWRRKFLKDGDKAFTGIFPYTFLVLDTETKETSFFVGGTPRRKSAGS